MQEKERNPGTKEYYPHEQGLNVPIRFLNATVTYPCHTIHTNKD